MAKRNRRQPRPPAPKSNERPDWLPHVAILSLLVIVVYANAISNGFAADDNWQLLKNPFVTDPADLPKLFGSGVWSFLGAKSNFYRPLQFVVYMLVYELAGFRAPAFHLLMVWLHAVNTVLLYFLVRRLASGRVAIAAAALFAVHPIHTEAVDWIAALPDVMVTLLALIGILWLARRTSPLEPLQIAGHCGLYLLAMLFKETGVMILPLYFGFGFFCAGRRWKEFRFHARLYAGMVAVLAVYLVMRRAALGGLAPAQQMYFHLKPVEFVFSVVVTAAQYLAHLLFPVNLNYSHVFHPTGSITLVLVASLVALAAVAVGFFRVRTALIAYGIFWVVVTIVPTLNITGLGPNVFAERYLYLPSAGFCWIAAWAWDWWATRQASWAKAAAAVLLVACAGEAMSRNGDWRDDFTLFQKTAQQSPTSAFVQDGLAAQYVARQNYHAAIQHERLAVQYQPDMAIYRTKLGYLLMTKDPRTAVAEFRKAAELEPSAAQGHTDLGMALESTGEASQAADEYKKALELQPQDRDANEGYRRVMSKLR